MKQKLFFTVLYKADTKVDALVSASFGFVLRSPNGSEQSQRETRTPIISQQKKITGSIFKQVKVRRMLWRLTAHIGRQSRPNFKENLNYCVCAMIGVCVIVSTNEKYKNKNPATKCSRIFKTLFYFYNNIKISL